MESLKLFQRQVDNKFYWTPREWITFIEALYIDVIQHNNLLVIKNTLIRDSRTPNIVEQTNIINLIKSKYIIDNINSSYIIELEKQLVVNGLPNFYKLLQNVVTVFSSTVIPLWTPLDLGSALKIFSLTNTTDNLNMDTLDRVIHANNLGVSSGKFVRPSQGDSPIFVSGTSSMDMSAPSRRLEYDTLADISSDTQGEWNIVGCQLEATTRSPIISLANSGNNNSRLFLWQLTTSDDAARPYQFNYVTDAAAASSFTFPGPAVDAFHLLSVSSNSSLWSIYINNVSQTLSNLSGSNNGAWNNTIAFNNTTLAYRGSLSTLTGKTKYRMIMYTNRPLTTQERQDLYDYCVRLNLV